MKKKLFLALCALVLSMPTNTYAVEIEKPVEVKQVTETPTHKMLTLQVLIETYAIDHNDFYPKSIYELNDLIYEVEGKDSTTKDKNGKVIYTNKIPLMYKFINDYVDFREYKKHESEIKNKIVYEAIPDKDKIIKTYRIFYIDENGQVYKKNNQVLTFSNAD